MIYDCLIFYEKQKEWERQTNGLSAWTLLRFCFLFWLVKKIGQLFIKTSLQGILWWLSVMVPVCPLPCQHYWDCWLLTKVLPTSNLSWKYFSQNIVKEEFWYKHWRRSVTKLSKMFILKYRYLCLKINPNVIIVSIWFFWYFCKTSLMNWGFRIILTSL